MAKALLACDPKQARPSKAKILIFGKPSAGKTWASLDFPSVFFIDVEGGANLPHYTDKLKASGGVYLGPEKGACDFTVVLDQVQALATERHPYKTLVIDSFSKLFESQIAATAEGLEKAGRKNEFGADKKPAIGLTRRLIRWFDRLDMNVILVCHERPVWKDGEQIGVTYAGYEKLEYELHLALHIIKQGASRKARVTKSRFKAFNDGDLFDWSYADFAERYGRDVMEAEAMPAELATPEQITRYNELLKAVKVDAKILEKWEENCPDLQDLDRDGMQKRIDYLSNLIPKGNA